ncbi:MAG: FkbM family methyltransferase [Saprospirales bacterium]|nr:MAG: FkbM family methyltransferase [Saprospirales bacterium]
MKSTIKKIIKLSPIPLSRNHLYDIQTKKIIKTLNKNSNCIDIGCFIGEILDLLLKQAPEGQHFGIEPIPEKFNELKKKYAKLDNCHILNYAASNRKGESDFNFVVSNPSYSGLKKRDYDNPNEEDTTITVKTELLDNLIPEDLHIDFMKIDVEGAELQVLQGASRIIEKCKPIIVFEHGLGASDIYGTSPEMIFNYFQEKFMRISNLGSWLKDSPALSVENFCDQYYNKRNYYFIAHP